MSYYDYKHLDAAALRGKTITAVKLKQPKGGDDYIEFQTDSGCFRMHHHQDCCESVKIESIAGDLKSLIGSALIVATQEVSDNHTEKGYDSWTKTIYQFETRDAKVTINWLGESNGYYSESVDIDQIDDWVIEKVREQE